jgi:hypothetical protein
MCNQVKSLCNSNWILNRGQEMESLGPKIKRKKEKGKNKRWKGYFIYLHAMLGVFGLVKRRKKK